MSIPDTRPRGDRGRPSGYHEPPLRVGKVVNQYKVGKHFELDISDTCFSYHRNETKIREEAALDGIYVIRTSVDRDTFSSESAVRAYKDLAS